MRIGGRMRRGMIEAMPDVLDGLTSVEASGGRHGATWKPVLTERAARGGLKVTRNLTTACTRPPTRGLSNSCNRSGRRVMPGV